MEARSMSKQAFVQTLVYVSYATNQRYLIEV
ncbi:hypothetical protein U27_05478 [Candidatus Vecturithrix granuli]|uniref:Uncharacterized protein n=1 Tax=Vecturithrix granuli TaxID=1499967 RepID=A0A081C1P9_VECG1|nr:hypothetical protein U27_05478 [Candidatus Vecturithrix granuli]